MNNPKNDVYYLQKIITDLNFIIEHMQGISLVDLQSNEVLFDSMMFRLIQIQENCSKLTEDYKNKHSNVPWRDISGLRNRIVHDYGNVDLEVIFDVLTNDIPKLRKLLN